MLKDTSGPAFPTNIGLNKDKTWIGPGSDGITIRDYFAAKAMQGLIGCSDWRESMDEHNASDFTAFSAYAMADAMLKARGENNA